MLKWIVIYLVVGIVAEFLAGFFAAGMEDKAGLGDLTYKEHNAIVAYYLISKGNKYFVIMNSLPDWLSPVLGTILSVVFWPIHAPWIYTVNKKAVEAFKAFDEGTRETL